MPDYAVRLAAGSDAAAVQEIAQLVQNKLIGSGSIQQIAGYSQANISARIDQRELYVLVSNERIIGSAFAEMVTPERFPQIASWKAVLENQPAWFLYGLIISPDCQGRGWGRVLLHGICGQEAFAPPAILLLDCWAGNHKLRRFYTDAGFELHGIFAEEGYEIAVFRWNF